MNNFNVVLNAIRRRCHAIGWSYCDCFDCIKSDLNPQYHDDIDFYLDFLQDLGLIKYDTENKGISITVKGKFTERLFA